MVKQIPSIIPESDPISVDAKASTMPVPWTTGTNDSMFRPIDIDGQRWNRIFPYRLLVVRAVDSGYEKVFGAGLGKEIMSADALGLGQFRVLFKSMDTSWEYNFHMSPQQMSVSTPFAISNTSTLRGIVEEHNGVKYKVINMAGSFGIFPNRPSVVNNSSPSIASSLFSGSIAATLGVANQLKSLVSTISNQPRSSSSAETAIGGYEGTGYAQALLLDQFLERYAEAKKDPDNSDWRLVLDIPKQNQSFLVTPMQFAYNQSVESPNEYKYSLQLKAYRRVDLNASGAVDNSLPPLNANMLQRVLSSIAQARRVLGESINLVKAVRSDFQTPLNALRQSALFYKDLAGVAAALVDLPSALVEDLKSAGSDAIKTLDQGNQIFTKSVNKLKKAASDAEAAAREGIPLAAVLSGQLGAQGILSQKTSPSNKVFESPEESFDLLNSVSINSMSLTPAQQDAINTELENAQLLTVDDLRKNRDVVLELATQISNNYGTSTDLYSKMYGTPTPYNRVQDMTIDELAVLKALYDVVQAMDLTTATRELDDLRIQDAYDFVNDLADDSNVPFQQSISKILVPVPFNFSIEEIAARYLGNPDRWLEIVTLNALKSPYIDETGFSRSLLSNASGRQFNIDSSENLYIGQKVSLRSLSQPPTTRRITDIEKISDSNYLITTDGLDNLDVYTVSAQARMQAYLPATVNSQNQIFIPSNEASPNDIRAKSVPVADQDALTGLSKIDWLQQENGDVAIDSMGDVRLAFGMTNLIQALKMKFAVSAGKLLKNPKYGNGVQVGSSTADLQLSELYKQVRATVLADARFGDVNKLEILLDGPTLTFNLSVTIAQNRGILPITFSVRV